MITALFFFSSCSEAPKTVISRTENESVTESLESKAESDLVFDTVENVTKNAASVLGNKYQNIVLPESIDIPVTDKAYTMSASRRADKSAVDVRQILDDFALKYVGEKPQFVHVQGIETVEVAEARAKAKGIPPEEYADYIDYDQLKRMEQSVKEDDIKEHIAGEGIGAETYYLEVFSGGTLYGSRTAGSNWLYRRSKEYASYTYDLKKDDIKGVSYKVAEEDYLLTDALELAESFMKNDLFPFLKNDDDVRAKRIYVFENFGIEGDNYGYSEGNYRYVVSFDNIIGGIPISKSGSGQLPERHMAGNDLFVEIAVPGVISEVHSKMYPYIKEKKECEKIITLGSALANVEKMLAPFGVYDVKEVTLEYCAVEDGVTGLQQNTSFEYRPMWCLSLGEGQHHWTHLERRKALYIDALDGTVRLWDDASEKFEIDGGKTVS